MKLQRFFFMKFHKIFFLKFHWFFCKEFHRFFHEIFIVLFENCLNYFNEISPFFNVKLHHFSGNSNEIFLKWNFTEVFSWNFTKFSLMKFHRNFWMKFHLNFFFMEAKFWQYFNWRRFAKLKFSGKCILSEKKNYLHRSTSAQGMCKLHKRMIILICFKLKLLTLKISFFA